MLLLSVAHKKSLYFGEKYENLNKCETICSVMLRKLLIVLFYLFGENALPILGCEIFQCFSSINKIPESFWNHMFLDHDITLKILEFVLNAIEKVKPVFLLSSMCIFSESNVTKS